jgi:hypothetical protein
VLVRLTHVPDGILNPIEELPQQDLLRLLVLEVEEADGVANQRLEEPKRVMVAVEQQRQVLLVVALLDEVLDHLLITGRQSHDVVQPVLVGLQGLIQT